VRTRSGDCFKPSAVRGYAWSMEKRVLPDLGGARLSEVTRNDLQDLADGWLAEGLDPSTIRNTLMPMRALYRRALRACPESRGLRSDGGPNLGWNRRAERGGVADGDGSGEGAGGDAAGGDRLP
jgi:hypothetical protein